MAFLPGDSVWCVCVRCIDSSGALQIADGVCVCVCACACARWCIPLLIDCRLAVLYADEGLSAAEPLRNAAFHATNTHTCCDTPTHISKTHKYSHMQHQTALGGGGATSYSSYEAGRLDTYSPAALLKHIQQYFWLV